MARYGDGTREVLLAAEQALEMVETQGWMALAGWVRERSDIDRRDMERGVGSWDEYQRLIGRLEAFNEVLARPGVLVKAAETVSGDNQ